MSALLTVIKYVPQIYTTFRLKHPGTLSIGMMCIQTPGGFVFTATLFFTKGLIGAHGYRIWLQLYYRDVTIPLYLLRVLSRSTCW